MNQPVIRAAPATPRLPQTPLTAMAWLAIGLAFALKDAEEPVRKSALFALQVLGPSAKPAAPHLVPMLKEHVKAMPMQGRDALVFPAADGKGHIAPSTLYRVFYPAREAAGRPDLRWHDLRHTGAVLAAQTGATMAELMARLGHSTPQAAMRYQHAAKGRDAEIARLLSAMVEGASK